MKRNVAVVIPAYREHAVIEKTLASLEASYATVADHVSQPTVIVVVNNPKQVSTQFVQDNQKMLRLLEDWATRSPMNLIALDYTDPGLDKGVGEARKIGMDYAVAKHLPFDDDVVVSLDADCEVDLRYFQTLFTRPLKEAVGFTLGFAHPTQKTNTVLYELYLRYMKQGLAHAGSAFAFTAIGSCLGASRLGYQKSGGMVAKTATEDFHFLNRLRKVGPLSQWQDTIVHPSDRNSARAPLGTGVFLAQAGKDLHSALQQLVIASPLAFERLGRVEQAIVDFAHQDSLLESLKNAGEQDSYAHLQARGIVDKLYAIKENCASRAMFRRRRVEVWDGLETFRLLRWMMQPSPPVRPQQLIQWAQALANMDHDQPLDLLQAYRQLDQTLLA